MLYKKKTKKKAWQRSATTHTSFLLPGLNFRFWFKSLFLQKQVNRWYQYHSWRMFLPHIPIMFSLHQCVLLRHSDRSNKHVAAYKVCWIEGGTAIKVPNWRWCGICCGSLNVIRRVRTNSLIHWLTDRVRMTHPKVQIPCKFFLSGTQRSSSCDVGAICKK